MTTRHWIVWAAAFALTIFVSIFWHVVLFEQAYLELGVYTRMDSPIYVFGLLAWLMESAAFVAIFFQTRWAKEGISGGLAFAGLMAAFTAAASLIGTAAKVEISDLMLWFALSGGFLILHFGLMGLVVGALNQRLQKAE